VALSGETLGREAAAHVRQALGLDDAPIADMIEVIEARAKCDVAIEPMPDGMHGMVATDPRSGKSIIAVATSEFLVRQRSSLAHELGHLELGGLRDHVAAYCSARTPEEVAADAFARHLLAPEAGIRFMRSAREQLSKDRAAECLSDVVRTFQVSPEMAIIQMRAVGWIDQAQSELWRGAWTAKGLSTRFGWRSEYEAWAVEGLRRRPPRRLLQRALDGYVAGLVSIAAVAKVMGTGSNDALAQLEAEGIRPDTEQIDWFDPDAWPSHVRSSSTPGQR
jgi:Zn-dependent peptidase ImmA (M78 family)